MDLSATSPSSATWLLSLVSAVVVAVLVAFLGHWFTSRRKHRDEVAELRLKACTDFINAATRLVTARRMGRTDDAVDELWALNDAKVRICICAEPAVVEALTAFWKHGGTLEKELEILAFTRFCMRVRESLGYDSNDIPGTDLSDTLFKLQPAIYSYKNPVKGDV